MHVISKMREAYERRRFIVTPAQWFAMDMPKELSAFGIIGLRITEIPPPSEEEYACLASFYFFYPPDAEDTDADLLPVITLHEDTVFLSRKKAGWRIYSLIQNDESELSAAQTSQLIGELYLIYREEE